MFDSKSEEYKRELNKTKLMIKNIESLNGSVNNLYENLENLILQNEETSFSFSSVNKLDYRKNIKLLKKLQKDLAKYELIYKINASLNYLQAFISNDLTEKDVDKCADEIITSLKVIKYMDISLISQFDNIFNDFYECVYNIIKLEFIHNNKSRVLDYILKDKTHISEINDLIRNDINNLLDALNETNEVKKLKIILSEIDKTGIDSSYVCEKVLKVLIVCTNYEQTKLIVLKKVNNIESQLKNNLNQVENNIDQNGINIENYNNDKKRLAKLYKTIKGKIIPLILTGALFSGTLSPLIKKDSFTTSKYNTTFIEHSSAREEPTTRKEYLNKIEGDCQVLLEKNIVNQEYVQREIYDVTEYLKMLERCNFDMYINTDNLRKVSSEKVEFVDITDKLNMDKSIYTVMYQDESDSISNFEKNKYIASIVLFILIFVLGELIICKEYSEGLFIDLSIYRKKKKSLEKDEKYYKEQIEEIIDLLNQNEELNIEFMKIYNEYENLIDNNIKEEINSLLKRNLELKLDRKKFI